MGLHSKNELLRILAQFNLKEDTYTFSTMNSGFINDTYLVAENSISKYILQRVNQSVFKDVDGLMKNIDYALRHLNSPDYSKVQLLHTVSNKTHFSDANGFWRIMTYIENSTTFDNTKSKEIASEAGRIIGSFHALLKSADIDNYVDTIPQFHSLTLRKKQFEDALSSAEETKKKIATKAITFTTDMLQRLVKMENTELPLRICHNDTKLNNILFSKESDKALCLIDLDTIMKGHFHYDFGDAIRTIANTAPEDEQDHSKITFEKPLFEAFVTGLAQNDSFLTADEIQALPYGTVLMPFLHGIRALTDYLNNNIYYKVAYENQNLDRCLSLFDFTQKAFNEFDYIKEITTKLLK